MTRARDELLDALRAAMDEVSPGNTLAAMFETPRQAAHGDLACTAADGQNGASQNPGQSLRQHHANDGLQATGP